MKLLPFQEEMIRLILSKERIMIFIPRHAGRKTLEKAIQGHLKKEKKRPEEVPHETL